MRAALPCVIGALGAALLLAASCTPIAERTQVRVSIDADASLHPRIARVDVELRLGAAVEAATPTRTQQLPAATGNWPLRMLIARGEGADNRYQLNAYAKDAEEHVIAVARAGSLFVEGRTLELGLHFDAECADLAEDCPAQTSCQNGQCTSAFVPPESLPGAEPAPKLAADGGMTPIMGSSCQYSSCPAAQSCEQDNGGCDPLRGCRNASNGPQCGPCPTGFTSENDRSCGPVLLSLIAEGGSLSPELSPTLTTYTLALPLRSEQLSLTLTVAAGVQITVDGRPLASGERWTTAAPAFGDRRTLVIGLHRQGYPSRTLQIELQRSGEVLGFAKAGNPDAGDLMGKVIAASGNTVAMGAPFEDGSARSTMSEPDDSVMDSGAVYVFVRDATGVLRQEGYLKADMPQAGEQFGFSLALEGDRLVVGTRVDGSVGSGAAYVFERQNGAWSRVKVLKPDTAGGNQQSFGYSVGLSGDTIAVGASTESTTLTGSGAIYVFTRVNGEWTQQAKLKANKPGPADWLGSGVAISGDWVAAGATGRTITTPPLSSGFIYLFKRTGDSWAETQSLQYPEPTGCLFFGELVVLSGSTLAATCWVAAVERPAGAVYLYERDAEGKYQPGNVLTASASQSGDMFGRGIALQGDSLLVGAPGERSAARGIGGRESGTLEESGAAYLFTRQGDAWHELVRIKAPQPAAKDNFGNSVALGSSGLIFVAASGDAAAGSGSDAAPTPRGAPTSGALHVFR